jgi:hypothetical protein
MDRESELDDLFAKLAEASCQSERDAICLRIDDLMAANDFAHEHMNDLVEIAQDDTASLRSKTYELHKRLKNVIVAYDMIRDQTHYPTRIVRIAPDQRGYSKMKKQMHIRASTLTEKQIDDLCAWLGTTKTGAMALAIERLWQEMKKEQGAISAIRDALAIESLWAPGENWGEAVYRKNTIIKLLEICVFPLTNYCGYDIL